MRPILPYRAVCRCPLFPHSNGGMYLMRKTDGHLLKMRLVWSTGFLYFFSAFSVFLTLTVLLHKGQLLCFRWDPSLINQVGGATGWRSLFGQQGAGFQQVAAQHCVLAGDLWRFCPALQVQTPDNNVEDGCHGSQLHAIKHSGQLGSQRVSLLGVGHGGHDGHTPPSPLQVGWRYVGIEPDYWIEILTSCWVFLDIQCKTQILFGSLTSLTQDGMKVLVVPASEPKPKRFSLTAGKQTWPWLIVHH